MKFDRFVNLILEELDKNKFLVLLPGGFKPPTLGHYNLIKSYSSNPQVEKVIVLVGPKEREGFTREQSLEILKLYGIDKLPKVSIEETKFDNPMQAAFEFLISDPRRKMYKNLTFGIGASDKGGDEARSFGFVNYFKNNPDKLPSGFHVGVPPIVRASQFGDADVSATTLRQAIRVKDMPLIKSLVPQGTDVKKLLAIVS